MNNRIVHLLKAFLILTLNPFVTPMFVSSVIAENAAPETEPRVISLGVGTSHTCALRSNGRIKCWGYNGTGQLGLGDVNDRGLTPEQLGQNLPEVDLGAGLKARALSVGHHTSCAILESGSIKCWGYNGHGLLGVGDLMDRGRDPNSIGDFLPAVNLGEGRTAIAVSLGGGHACAILDNHSLKCWGRNNFGQLGLGDTHDRGGSPDQMGDSLPVVDLGLGRTAIAMGCGEFHTCALLDDRSLKCWGYNIFGQLGQGDVSARGTSPEQMGDSLKPVNLGNGVRVRSVNASGHFSCAILEDGRVKCFGSNDSGQLGLEDTADRGLRTDQLGERLKPVNIEPGLSVDELSCGFSGCCARVEGGLLKCWGAATSGRLGYGDELVYGDTTGSMGTGLPFVNLGKLRSAVSIVAGEYHTCALLESRQVKCWGSNRRGQLGQGDALARGNRPETVPAFLPEISLW